MNIFIIHSGCDKELVEKNIASLRREAFNANALILKYGGRFWKHEAKSKIKASHALVVFLGKNSYASPNIGWEIEEGKRQGKIIYTVNLFPDVKRHDHLYIENSFLNEKTSYDKTVTITELADIINDFENGEYKLFNPSDSEFDTATMLEQYKLFLATSESVVDRRQSTNNFFITVNSALLAFYGAITAFSIQPYIKTIMGAVLSIIGIILCFSWARIITSYGNLNGSKMKIISLIEKRLPLSLYDAEWAALSDKLNKKKYVSFSNSEKITPKLFGGMYVILFIALTLLLIFRI